MISIGCYKTGDCGEHNEQCVDRVGYFFMESENDMKEGENKEELEIIGEIPDLDETFVVYVPRVEVINEQ